MRGLARAIRTSRAQLLNEDALASQQPRPHSLCGCLTDTMQELVLAGSRSGTVWTGVLKFLGRAVEASNCHQFTIFISDNKHLLACGQVGGVVALDSPLCRTALLAADASTVVDWDRPVARLGLVGVARDAEPPVFSPVCSPRVASEPIKQNQRRPLSAHRRRRQQVASLPVVNAPVSAPAGDLDGVVSAPRALVHVDPALVCFKRTGVDVAADRATRKDLGFHLLLARDGAVL